MGLDQFLYAKKYASDRYFDPEIYTAVLDAVDAHGFVTDEVPAVCVSVKVGYWRKANAIHQWFVTNCQSGVDDCKEVYVDREELTKLHDLCQQVINDNSLASDLLPTQSGFFYGSTSYDDWYFDNLQDTIDTIDRCLVSVPSDWDFYYSSSW